LPEEHRASLSLLAVGFASETDSQVIVERVKPQPLRVFSVNLSSAITNVTVSPEFIQGNAEYAFEVLAIEASGNQTISEGTFKTQ